MNEFQSLILRGMHGFFHASDVEILKEIATGMRSGKYKVFRAEYAAFCILYMPQTPLDVPQVLHFYSEKPALRRALVGTVLDFVKKSGYNTLRAINGSGLDDAIWTRAFRHKGWEIKPKMTVFDFEVVK